jgi:endonuclease/exonuclease/phosphatase family metal-dependent hydrolase
MVRRLLAALIVIAAVAVAFRSSPAAPAAAGAPAAAAQPAAAPPALRVMSFNIRYGTANDGPDHWDKRRDMLVETIRRFDPDLLGTQETLLDQAEFLAEKLSRHEWLGVGRDDAKRKGESVAIYWRKDRFDRRDGGHFWLSEAPDTPGSKSWDAAITRMVTWVRLRDQKSQGAGSEFLWLNTHFDHRGPQARLESAKVIRRWLRRNAADLPVIVTGDFNDDAGGEPFKALVGGEADAPALTDAYRKLHPQRGEEEATFHGFKGGRKGERIDWILCSRPFAVAEAAIDHSNTAGRYPSDHYPVTAVLRVER